jgi:hypothetical protein
MFHGLVSSMEPQYRALSRWVEEAYVHMCYLEIREAVDWRPLPAVVISKPL